MNAAQELFERIAMLQPSVSMPAQFYTSREVFDWDMELIFAREWLAVGHTCELPNPGDYFTVQIGKESLIVIRGLDEQIRCFFNTCRHRGSVICIEPRGKRRRLTCPYHQWTYDLEGRLIAAREMGHGFDRSAHSLQTVHVQIVGGIVYVCLASTPPSLDSYKAIVEPYVAPHGIEDLKVAAEISIVEKGNWKLVWENNRECYHCTAGHPTLLRSLPQIDDPNDPVSTPEHRARMAAQFKQWDAANLPYHAVNENGWRITRMPLNENMASMTPDGQSAVPNFRLGMLPEGYVGSLRNLHLPNTWNHFQADHCISFRVLPLGPTETQLTTKWLVHKDAIEGTDYTIENLTAVWKATNDEDRTFVERNQLGVNMRAYRPGPYSPTAEAGVVRFVSWYYETMKERLAALVT